VVSAWIGAWIDTGTGDDGGEGRGVYTYVGRKRIRRDYMRISRTILKGWSRGERGTA
jgi:hypothetical protein